MKIKLLLAAMLTTASVSLFAQEGDSQVRTLFNRGEATWGGEVSFYGSGSSFDDRFFGGGGFECGAIRNQALEFGFFIAGFGSESHTDYQITPDDKYFYGGGYGGLLLKPIIMSNAPVHFAIPIRVGGGCVGYYSSDYFWDDDCHYHNYNHHADYEDETGVFVFQPGINVEFNMLRHFRMWVGASYRMFGSLNLDYRNNGGVIIGKQDLDGMIYSVGFSFGIY